jgi:hypothetical protein
MSLTKNQAYRVTSFTKKTLAYPANPCNFSEFSCKFPRGRTGHGVWQASQNSLNKIEPTNENIQGDGATSPFTPTRVSSLKLKSLLDLSQHVMVAVTTIFNQKAARIK